MNSRSPLVLLPAIACVMALVSSTPVRAADSGVTIRQSANRTIPIALSGFSDEIRKVLELDLYVVGFDVNTGKPQYQLTASPGAAVRATLADVNNPQPLFVRAYPGGSQRAQAHALADDVVKTLLQIPGIAATRIAFKNSPGGRNGKGETISEIWASDYDGANAVALTGDTTIAAAPCWVPGKLELFYTSYRAVRPEIYLQNLR